MKKIKLVKLANIGYVSISILSLTSVAVLSLINPQATMDLVNVKLNNTDAISSIRGVYGGVGITLAIGIGYLLTTKIILAVRFLTLFWCSYILSRLLTIFSAGPLGDFGNQWIVIESVLFMLGILLIILNRASK